MLRHIAKAIKAGSEEAYSAFYNAEYGNVVFFILSYLGKKDVAEDLAQDSFLALWHRRSSIDPERNLRSFIFRIAHNKALNWIRDNSKFVEAAREDAETLLNIKALDHESVHMRIERMEVTKAIEDVYASLPFTVSETFRLAKEERMTYFEISRILNISYRTIEYNLVKAKREFKRILLPYLTMPCLVIAACLVESLF